MQSREERLATHKRYYYKHREQALIYGRARGARRNLALKLDILTHYGSGRCACVKCGESRLACLSIDHMNGGGSRHKQELESEGRYRSGHGLYWWLKGNGYPKGYQTLCMNCQWVKRFENREANGAPKLNIL